jgi:septal ring factor EnvC (AmiA/AmiB activator)
MTRAARRADKLAAQAVSLRELIAVLRQNREAEQKARPRADTLASLTPPPGYTNRPFDAVKGQLASPVVGRVVGRYGQRIATGRTRKGVSLESAPSAQIIAPHEGRIVFAGVFRGYGELLIIEHRGGYHTLLAGVARIDVIVGQWVLGGEPIGAMARDETRKPVLYLEIRRGGHPINPLPWLAAYKDKVSG